MMAKRILVVDDDPVLREGMEKILSSHEYHIETAANGFEALDSLPRFQPHLVISDTSMPGMSGAEFCRRARATAEGQRVPFLFLVAPSEVLPALPGVGRSETLTKPFGPEQLLASVETVFRQIAESQVIHTVSPSILSPELLSPFFHEFRTSLTMIKTCIALLTNPKISYDPTELREFLDIVRRGGDRIDRLVRDFLVMLKLASGVAEQEAREASQIEDIAGLIQSVLQGLQFEIEERNVPVEVDLAAALPELLILDEHLQTMLEKVVHNAIKFSRPGGRPVQLRVSSNAEAVRFEVIDHGIGIPQEEQERIFDGFYQLSRAGLERQGAGLGLAVTKGLTQLYGGRISVHSQVDRGSTFTILIPVEPQIGGEPLAQETAEAAPPTEPAPQEAEEGPSLTAEEAFRRLGITFGDAEGEP